MWLETALMAAFLAAAIRMATPLILAALGELFAERSGVLNLAVEGLMLMGAFIAYWAADQTKSAWLGLAAAVGAGVLLGLVLGVLYVSLRLDQIVAGLAANIVVKLPCIEEGLRACKTLRLPPCLFNDVVK